MDFGTVLRTLRRQNGYTQQELAQELALAKSTVCMYERGERIPPYKTMRAIADLFGVEMDLLYGRAETDSARRQMPEARSVPVLGKIACGEPIFAEREYAAYAVADSALHADFCLIARGDSMVGARICDGDTVFIRRQSTADNGQIAAVVIGDEATLKRWYYYPAEEKLVLMPENPAYRPLVYIGDALDNVRCLGIAVGFMAHL